MCGLKSEKGKPLKKKGFFFDKVLKVAGIIKFRGP